MKSALLGAALLLVGCPSPEDPPTEEPTPDRSPCADRDPDRRLLWGDLHVHTAFSFDAFFEDVRTTPDQAYAFARGEPVLVPPLGPDGAPALEVRLERPLDFAAVTDHAEFLGEIQGCSDPASPVYDGAFCVDARADGSSAVEHFGSVNALEEPARFEELCGEGGFDCLAAAGDAWTRTQQAAEAAYDRSEACAFTTFVGYEWTGTTGVSNLHRNVIFGTDVVPALPTSYVEEPTARGLWQALEADCRGDEGCEVLAIPHNSNLSNGLMFAPDRPITGAVAAAELRGRMEPLMEVYQHKGASECVAGLSGIEGPVDPECAFEAIRPAPLDDCGEGTGGGGMIGLGCASDRDALRGALLTGMAEERDLGVNPLRLGVIASTDTHLGTPGFVDEEAFVGHTGGPEDTVLERLSRPGLRPVGLLTSPGGLVGAWAEANDRPALFAALQRREVFGSSGPRIALRFFGGAGLDEGLCAAPDLVARADAGGVPMGGDLPAGGGAPTFLAAALADPGTAARPGHALERLQVVKLWLDAAGLPHQAVFDLADSGQAASVDPDTCLAEGEGAGRLCGAWTDADFDPALPAAWYVRALEVPSCRWSRLQCLELPEAERPAGCSDPDAPPVIRERAWSSPIWYRP